MYTVRRSVESNSDDDYDYVDERGRRGGVGIMEMRHFYGCTPLERGTNASHLTVFVWRTCCFDAIVTLL